MEYDFLKELKDCYETNGHDFWRSVFLFCYSSKEIKSGSGKFKNKFVHDSIKMNFYDLAAVENGNSCKKFNNKKEAEEAFKARKSVASANKQWGVGLGTFMDIKDMAYSLAWELAQKIGRLPDPLHARMSLSVDRHPVVSRYVERFGA